MSVDNILRNGLNIFEFNYYAEVSKQICNGF